MHEPTVAAVMNSEVITARPDSTFHELVASMIENSISALPVVDEQNRPIGVVAESDALAKLEFHGGADYPSLLASWRTRTRWHKSHGLTAAELMTKPAISTRADTPVSAAVRRLAHAGVRRLCVVDDAGVLVGVLARRDVLRMFLRSDETIQADVERELRDSTLRISVRVTGGVATLDGAVRTRTMADRAERITHSVLGVIHVHNNVSFDVDDELSMGL